MTTIFEEEVNCAVCGAKQTVQEMGSTSSFGPMDLDTRPPPLQRGTMEMWVHECSECGYVAPELEKAAQGDAQIVASADYRAELAKTGRVRQASWFVCRSLLDQSAGDLVTAGWRRLHAAWVCDDVANVDEAREQRLAALKFFERARAQGKLAMKSVVGGDQLLLADIARKARCTSSCVVRMDHSGIRARACDSNICVRAAVRSAQVRASSTRNRRLALGGFGAPPLAASVGAEFHVVPVLRPPLPPGHRATACSAGL